MGWLREKYTRSYYLPARPDQGYGVAGYQEFLDGTVYEPVHSILATVDWSGKRVLEIGPGRGEALRFCFQHGASSALAIDFAEPAVQITRETLEAWSDQVEVVHGDALELEHEDEFDVCLMFDVLEHIPEEELQVVLWRVVRALKPGGLLLWHTPNYVDKQRQTATDLIPETAGMHVNKKDYVNFSVQLCDYGFRPYHEGSYPTKSWFAWEHVGWERPEPRYDAPKSGFLGSELDSRPRSNVILHVHNVRRCGGTSNFVYDFARCFPEFHHVALCVNDPAGDPAWIREVSAVMRTMYASQLTPELLEEIGPLIVVLHSTAGQHLAGEWPYGDWLSGGGKRFVIGWHHTGTYPLVSVDLDVFVSQYVEGKYLQILDRMKQRIVVPPCTDLAPYAEIERVEFDPGWVATTAGKGSEEARKVLAQRNGTSGAWVFDHSPPGKLGSMPGYLAQFQIAVIWSGHQETWCRTVSEAMAAGCLTIAHRAGAIPEQIEHGRTGFLFDTSDDLLKLLDEIETRQVAPERCALIAAEGRRWALENVGFPRLREALYPHLMRAVLGAV